MEHFQKVLRQPNFFRLWIGQIISSIGDRFYQIALLTLVLGLNAGTQIGKEGARILFVGMIPGLVFAPLLGLAVDRFNRKAVLVFADLSRVVFALSLLYIWGFRHDLALVYVVVFFMGGMNSLFIPARQAALPQIVSEGDLITANALISLVGVIASLVGAIGATTVSSIFGANLSFTLTAVGFLCSAFFLLRVDASLQPEARSAARGFTATWREIAGGWEYVRKEIQTQWVIILNTLFAFVSGFFAISVLEFTVRSLDTSVLKEVIAGIAVILSHFAPKPPVIDVSVIALVVLMGALGVGMAMGIFSCGPARRWTRSTGLPFASFFLVGVIILIFSRITTYLPALAICAILGWVSAVFTISIDARLQTEVPDACRGRVFALRNFCTSVAFLVALAFHLSGDLLRILGAGKLIEALGAGMILSGLVLGWLNRRSLGTFWGEGRVIGQRTEPIASASTVPGGTS